MMKILESVTSQQQVLQVTNKFSERDPLVLAIDSGQEDLAIYLLERGFPHHNVYTFADQECDRWCYAVHQDGRCPTEYDARSLAFKHNLMRLHSILVEVDNGLRQPGDGLSTQQGPDYDSAVRCVPTPRKKELAAVDEGHVETAVYLAKKKIEEIGTNYIAKNGDTVIHESVKSATSAMVYACAVMGLPINAQNFLGDTALHLAVRRDDVMVIKALLCSGADFSIRNKLGQTPLDESSNTIRPLLQMFRCGLTQAVVRSEHPATQRLVRLCCNPNSNIKDGKSALEIAESRASSSREAQKCYNLLKENLKSLTLMNAVLGEDIETVRTLCAKKGCCNVNISFKDKKGWTPACHAIWQRNVQLLQLLVDSGSCHLNIRVREHDDGQSTATVPLYFLSLERNCPTELWTFLSQKVNCFQDRERDTWGRTAVFRAAENGKSADFMEKMLKAKSGHPLLERRMDGLTLREFAHEYNLDELSATIDKYLCETASLHFIVQMIVNFQGDELLEIKDKDGNSLLDLALEATTGQPSAQVTHNLKTVEETAVKLFEAAAMGDLQMVKQLNRANYIDKNGYTALTRAIVFNQPAVVDALITERPALKAIPDNCNRYPLHYAYALPADQSRPMVKLLFGRRAEDTEHKVDKDGREAVEFKDMRGQLEIMQMLHDARTLDAYQKVRT
ncbi:hypothetical protein NP493_1742g00003 [Ridgeia piscesae]|uniref:Uncharacterized protein n=1 Tax=Ridgeia piscesae TaxID=27915 RepID=A0AAD9N6Q5_RIDPI|nr:hypothetical protein NP493_1742g00003 [Ridgeia piscesae]